MPFEEFSLIISSLKKKLLYIAAVFGIGAMGSFYFMGKLIEKIKNDMFSRLNIPDRQDASGQLIDISHNLTSISREVNNSVIANNLTRLSGDLLNLSQNLNLYKPKIVYLTPLEVIMLEFKMSIIFGALLAAPLALYYAYRGLKGRLPGVVYGNKSLIISVITAAVLLFLTGAGYAYFYMLPLFLSYLYQSAASLGINANFSVYEFIYFIVMTTVVIGAAFELPLILNLLVHFGVTTRKTLAYYRRHAYIILLVVAAVITPGPDIFSQLIVAVPFIVLYEASLLVMRVTGK
jgi:sec-independent protein translocase protein TatC